jgi:hypothetical protein
MWLPFLNWFVEMMAAQPFWSEIVMSSASNDSRRGRPCAGPRTNRARRLHGLRARFACLGYVAFERR